MSAPDEDQVQRLKDCVRAFDKSAVHMLHSVRECLLAGRCLFDVAIDCVDRLAQRDTPQSDARKVEVEP